MAKEAGWKPDSEVHQETPAERQERGRQHQARANQETAERARRAAEAATKAAALWAAATPAGEDHPYLDRKGVQPVATLREISAEQAAGILGYTPKSDGEPLAGRLLLLPVKIDGRLSTLELIDESGRKSAIAGGAKSGGFWAAQALPDGDGTGLTLAIGEGAVTVLSVREATNYPAIAALSAGNLGKVARTMWDRYPAAKLLVLGDLGNGQAKAEEAAKATGAALAIPQFPEGEAGTDFNDLAQTAGLDAVKAQISAALDPAPVESDLLDAYIEAASLDGESFSRTWLVESMIEAGRVYEFFGAWKKGKTIAVIDLCAHASLGRTWGDRRTVPTLVVWVAGEACDDVRRRVAAWRLRHGITGPMAFWIRTKPVHLNVELFAMRLRAEIEAIGAKFPGLPVLLVIDTVARSLSPGTNENSIEGLGAFANNVIDLVVRPTGAAAICVHHSGHGDNERSRGHSSFAAAMDGSVKVDMDKPAIGPATITVSAVVMRSGAGDDALQFRVDTQELPGQDNFSNPIAEPVLHFLGKPVEQPKAPTGKAQRAVLDALEILTDKQPERPVSYSRFRKACADQDISRQSFADAFKALKATGQVIHEGPEVWLPSRPAPSERPRPIGLSDVSDGSLPESTSPKCPIRTVSDVSDGSTYQGPFRSGPQDLEPGLYGRWEKPAFRVIPKNPGITRGRI